MLLHARVLALLLAFLLSGCAFSRGEWTPPALPPPSRDFVNAMARADAHVDAGRYVAAIEAYKAAQQLEPERGSASIRLAAVYTRLSRSAETMSEVRAGLRLLEREFRQRPIHEVRNEYAESFFLLGRALEQTDQLRDAIVVYEQSRLLAPAREEYRLALLRAYVRTGQVDQATGLFEPTDDPAIPLLLALTALKRQEWTDAARELSRLRKVAGPLPTIDVLDAIAVLGAVAAKRPSDDELAATLRVLEKQERPWSDSLLVQYARSVAAELRSRDAIESWSQARRAVFVVDPKLTAVVSASKVADLIRSTLDDYEVTLRRAAMLKAGVESADRQQPRIDLDLRTLAAEIRYPFVIVTGVAEHADGIGLVLVNGRSVPFRTVAVHDASRRGTEVEFVSRVDLERGDNALVVEARSISGTSRQLPPVSVRYVPPDGGLQVFGRWGLFVSTAGVSSRADVDSMIDRLAAPIPPRQIERLVAERATRTGILNALQSLARVAADEAIVYLGLRTQVVHVGTERRVYFVPADASLDDLPATSIAASEVLRLLDVAGARRLVLILNTEHVGRILDQHGGWAKKPGRIVIGAAAGEAAVTSEFTSRPLFTSAGGHTIERAIAQTGELTVFEFAQRTGDAISKASGGTQALVLTGDIAVAHTLKLAVTTTGEALLEELLVAADEGRISREALVRGVSVLVQGVGSEGARQDMDTAVRRWGRREIDVQQLQDVLLERTPLAVEQRR